MRCFAQNVDLYHFHFGRICIIFDGNVGWRWGWTDGSGLNGFTLDGDARVECEHRERAEVFKRAEWAFEKHWLGALINIAKYSGFKDIDNVDGL